MSKDHAQLESIVKEGTAFETIQRRLSTHTEQLRGAINELNQARADVFGTKNMEVLGRARVRTENNAVARDVVRIGDQLLFGFNVKLGLKKALGINDVFSLYHLQSSDTGFEVSETAVEGSFLTEERFARDFRELQQYYSNAALLQIVIMKGMLLAVFQIGEKLTDVRVFRWELTASGEVARYVDNRGERDWTFPDRFSFAWTKAGREHQEQGREPHLNIADTLFIDNLRGDITFKIENNTNTGEGIYSDPVESDSQSLDDATFEYADLGETLLVRILPFSEKHWRYYIYNRREQKVSRVDALAGSVVALPDNHGLIFPSGFYLSSGELKTFEVPAVDLRFKRMIRSPNGEDVLYVFYAPESGQVVLYRYNLISKQTDAPMIGHGFALFENGQLAIFYADDEPTQVHPLRIWSTPFMSETFHAREAVANDTPMGRIGNPELVRGIAELNTIVSLAGKPQASERHFGDIIQHTDRTLDQFHWIEEDSFGDLRTLLTQLRRTAELMLDEYEKVQTIRAQSSEAIEQVARQQAELLRGLKPDSWTTPDAFVAHLKELRDHRGRLMALRDRRYIDENRLGELEAALDKAESKLTRQTFDFLATDEALEGYRKTLAELSDEVENAQSRDQLATCVERYQTLTSGLDMIQGMLSSMSGDNAAQQTRITENLSSIYATINQQRSRAEIQLREQGSAEARAQFAAQIRLFEQSLANGVGALKSPEDCDPLMTRMLDQLQELESQFGEYDEFLSVILEQRESAHESIEARRQQLQDQRQRRITTLTDAAKRIIQNIEKRTERFEATEELHAFFASDAMVNKVRDIVAQLRAMGASMESDDCQSQLRSTQDSAMRSIRDRADIYEDGGKIIRLGPRHRFSVNQQDLDLTLVPRDDTIMLHLTGTQFYEPLEDPRLESLSQYWAMSLPSESDRVYRGEYLAYLILEELQKPGATVNVADMEELTEYIRSFASPRYREGYEKGIHDHDAALIVSTLWPAIQSAGLLRYDPASRGLAMLYWARLKQDPVAARNLRSRCLSAGILSRMMRTGELVTALTEEVLPAIREFVETHQLTVGPIQCETSAEYLVRQLAEDGEDFVTTQYANELVDSFTDTMKSKGQFSQYEEALAVVADQPRARWTITSHWLEAHGREAGKEALLHYLPEAVAILNTRGRLGVVSRNVDLAFTIEGLLGQHPNLKSQTLALQLDDFNSRLKQHIRVTIPGWQQLQELRQDILQTKREQLRLDEFRPRPLSSFVRNKLISESYLPLIGDNLAKQMGTVGDKGRTDLMGLLMMISPPGYGKTTLMEYVANRLGLIFMKINCPSLGHDVISLDPEMAPHSTARAELIKLNLALEMGNNAMLYLDDIQHTHPEFLQKFISLCDGSRRIEGVWKGRTRTYDMRGKRFCVVMAGNPYTESGDVFKVPDMLANRADIYNLGDVLSGMEDVFALSYVENSLSSNPVLAPLANRGMDDFYRFADLAAGRNVDSSEFDHDYSAAERDEVVAVLKMMFRVRETVLRVNQAYIASSAQAEAYRTEPTFRLQGSYRNMNKLAEKISPVLTEDELESIIDDHYVGEAQLLTQGAEENLLKLKEMRGTLTEPEAKRWQDIKREFQRRQAAGGDEETGTKVVRQLNLIAEALANLSTALPSAQAAPEIKPELSEFKELSGALIDGFSKLKLEPAVTVNVASPDGLTKALTSFADIFEHSLVPIVRAMDGKLDLDMKTHREMSRVLASIEVLRKELDGRD